MDPASSSSAGTSETGSSPATGRVRCQNRNVRAPSKTPTPPSPATTAQTLGSDRPPVVVVDEPKRVASVVLVVEVVDDTVGPTNRSSVVVTVVEAATVVFGGTHWAAVDGGGRQAEVGAAVDGGSVTGGSVTGGTVALVGGTVLAAPVVPGEDVGGGSVAGTTCPRPPEKASAVGLDTATPNATPALTSAIQRAARTITARARETASSARAPWT